MKTVLPLTAATLIPLLVCCATRPQANLPLPAAKRQELASTMNASQKDVASTCSYFNFVVAAESPLVERERFTPGWQSVEKDRQIWLDATKQGATALGFTLVSDIEQAGFILQATGGNAGRAQGMLFLNVSLIPTPRLIHHQFVAAMNDETFPFTNNLGASYTITFPGQGYTPEDIWAAVVTTVELAWSQSHRAVLALCETSELLVSEGITMEELRQELVKEIQTIRERRVREKQMKHLEVQVEDRGE